MARNKFYFKYLLTYLLNLLGRRMRALTAASVAETSSVMDDLTKRSERAECSVMAPMP